MFDVDTYDTCTLHKIIRVSQRSIRIHIKYLGFSRGSMMGLVGLGWGTCVFFLVSRGTSWKKKVHPRSMSVSRGTRQVYLCQARQGLARPTCGSSSDSSAGRSASAEKDAAKQATGAEASAATAAEVKIIVQGIIVHEAPASSHERNAGRGRCSHVPCCVCGGTGEACQNEDTFWTVRD